MADKLTVDKSRLADSMHVSKSVAKVHDELLDKQNNALRAKFISDTIQEALKEQGVTADKKQVQKLAKQLATRIQSAAHELVEAMGPGKAAPTLLRQSGPLVKLTKPTKRK